MAWHRTQEGSVPARAKGRAEQTQEPEDRGELLDIPSLNKFKVSKNFV